MSLRRKFRTFLSRSWRQKAMICEAAIFLGLARVAVLTIHFRYIARWLEREPAANPAGRICDHALLLDVRHAVKTAARNVPWNAVCLPQALAARTMLARRGYGSAFHLGATFDQNGKLIAHAWLEAEGEIVVGREGMQGMALLARYGGAGLN